MYEQYTLNRDKYQVNQNSIKFCENVVDKNCSDKIKYGFKIRQFFKLKIIKGTVGVFLKGCKRDLQRFI